MTNFVFFDSSCIMCNRSILFMIKIDKMENFKFCSLQSKLAMEILSQFKITLGTDFSTMYVLHDKKIYTRSDCFILFLSIMGGYWKLISVILRLFPKIIRNSVYDFVSKHRKRFLKKNACTIPTESVRKRIIF